MTERRWPEPPRAFPPTASPLSRSIQDYDQATAPHSASLLRKNLDEARDEADAGQIEAARAKLERLRPALTEVERHVTPYSARTAVSLLGALVLAALGRLHEGRERADLFEQSAYLFQRAGSACDVELNARDRAEVALGLVESGRVDRARELIAELSSTDPQWASVALELAAALENRGELPAATQIYDRAVTLLQGDPNALSRVADALVRVGQPTRAAEALRDASTALARLGLTDQSHALLDRGLADGLPPELLLEVKTDLLLSTGEAKRALELLDRYAGDHPESPRLLAYRAMALLVEGDVEGARQYAARARIEGAGEPRGAFVEALALESLGELEASLQALSVAITGDPANPSLYFTRAQLQSQLGRPEDALTSIDAACAFDPALEGALLFRSATLRQLNRFPEAADTAQTALEQTPEDPAAMTELGLALLAVAGEANVSRALESLERAAAIRPNDAWVITALAVGYLQAGRQDEGIARLRQAGDLDKGFIWPRERLVEVLMMDREDPAAALDVLDGLLEDAVLVEATPEQLANWRARRGEVLRQLTRMDEAQQALEESLSLAPDDPYALGTLGQVLVASGQHDSGVERLRQAAQADPPLGWVVGDLAAALLEGGNPDEALEVMAQAHDRGLERSQTLNLLEGMRQDVGDDASMLNLVAAARRARPTWAEAGLLSCRLLAATGRLDEALAELEKLVEAEPDWDDALAAQCAVLRALGRADKAHKTIDSVLSRDPANGPFVEAKLSLLEDEGRHEEMLIVIDAALSRLPNAEWLTSKRATVLLKLDRQDEAAASFERLASLRPDPDVVSFVVEQMAEFRAPAAIVEMLRGLLEIVRRPERRVAIGRQLNMLGAGADALGAAEAALRDSPNNPGALLLQGMQLVELGRPLDGLASLVRGVDHTPEAIVHFYWLAQALCDVGCYGAAIPWADRALEEQSRHAWSLGIRAWALQNQGEHQRALAGYRAALEVERDQEWFLKGVADCLVLLGDREEAVPLLNELLARPETSLPTRDDQALRGWCLYRLGRFQDAAERFVAALAIDSLSFSSQFDLGLCTLCAGHGRRALAEYQRGIEASHVQPQRAAGWFRVALKDLHDASLEDHQLLSLPDYEHIDRLLSSAYENARVEVDMKLRAIGLIDDE